MNTIEAQIDKSNYEIYDDFLNIKIDGEWLDEKLDQFYPGEMYKGTIPTLLFAIEIDTESKIVWNRILPHLNTTSICPILMCPDDRDFSCTLIVAEIECINDVVKWRRIGLDTTKDWQPENIGSEVKWFVKIPPYEFAKFEYLKMIKSFEIQFQKDKSAWDIRNENFKNKT
ncbi:hypothetical protein KXD93_03820 [Mucilaginibacter sp. BJC16-A38]|uniref:hypothetical protein n=1 Tax=Mucilaginibacter phenanthrenivorans TaxID=1234842 RepID=UPI002157A2A4|nr:hypothetical protein [Mucilaginibacter phenanthrenivorans]MCR8556750.1 hypothetical protein [Mucilaginibacter phenanthrenivorans]